MSLSFGWYSISIVNKNHSLFSQNRVNAYINFRVAEFVF